jgi:hypothetical protein
LATEPTPALTPAERTARNTTLLVRFFIWIPLAVVGLILAMALADGLDRSSASSDADAKSTAVQQVYDAVGMPLAAGTYNSYAAEAHEVCDFVATGGQAFAAKRFSETKGATPEQADAIVAAAKKTYCDS